MEKCALIIIDMWDSYHNGTEYLKPYIEYMSLRISDIVENFDGPVVLSSYNTPNDGEFPWSDTHPILKLTVQSHSNSIISWNSDEVENFLKLNKINTLLYSGMSMPGCIEYRPLGMKLMNKDYKTVVVGDLIVNATSSNFNISDIIHETYRYIITSGYEIRFSKHI